MIFSYTALMIKAIILDVDGVILGHQDGVNFPLPSHPIQSALQNLSKSDLPISLCSAKATFALEPIAVACHLKSHHIADAGATLINIMTGEKISFSIPQETCARLSKDLLALKVYTEWYSCNDKYFTLPDGNKVIREARTVLFNNREALLSIPPKSEEIIKIIVLPESPYQRDEVTKIMNKYPELSLTWGFNPSKIPADSGYISIKSATKRTGVERLAKLNGVPLSDTLAVGDSTSDWTFMELCGYCSTLSNGTTELKELVNSRAERGFTSEKGIDNDGLLDIFKHFSIV